MKINIKTTHFKVTPELRSYLEEKLQNLVSKLLKNLEKKGEIIAQTEIARTTSHHQKGSIFYAEINLMIPGKKFRAEERAENIYIAIDEILEELERQIQKYRGSKRALFKKGAFILKRLFKEEK